MRRVWLKMGSGGEATGGDSNRGWEMLSGGNKELPMME